MSFVSRLVLNTHFQTITVTCILIDLLSRVLVTDIFVPCSSLLFTFLLLEKLHVDRIPLTLSFDQVPPKHGKWLSSSMGTILRNMSVFHDLLQCNILEKIARIFHRYLAKKPKFLILSDFCFELYQNIGENYMMNNRSARLLSFNKYLSSKASFKQIQIVLIYQGASWSRSRRKQIIAIWLFFNTGSKEELVIL